MSLNPCGGTHPDSAHPTPAVHRAQAAAKSFHVLRTLDLCIAILRYSYTRNIRRTEYICQFSGQTEEIVINKPLAVVLAEAEQTSLNQAIKKSDSLPGVAGTYELTSGGFGQTGTRRLVCLTDGTTTEEQVLMSTRTKSSAEFRYVVWNYTTPKARPILYGVGDFVRSDLGGRTHPRAVDLFFPTEPKQIPWVSWRLW